MPEFYSDSSIDIGGQQYDRRIMGTPRVTARAPQFYVGVQKLQPASISLANKDQEVQAKLATTLARGKSGQINETFIDSAGVQDTETLYNGLISKVTTGPQSRIDLVPFDTDLLDVPFPHIRTTTDNFPNAIDLDQVFNYVAGEARKIPLPLVKADDANNSFQYLVGLGHGYTINNVYRDDVIVRDYAATWGEAVGSSETSSIDTNGQTRPDDFFNNAFVESGGLYRRVTDYVGSNGNVDIESGFGVSFNSGDPITFREFKVIETTAGGVDVTLIEFYIPQRDSSFRLFDRRRVSADVTREPISGSNPLDYVKEILQTYFTDISIDLTSLNAAITEVTAEGSLRADGAAVTERTLVSVLNDLLLIGRTRMALGTGNALEFYFDSAYSSVNVGFDTRHNTVNISNIDQRPLSGLIKDFELKYRRLFNTSDYRLTTAKHTALTAGRKTDTLQNDFLFNKTAADKVIDFLAKRYASLDTLINIDLGTEARSFKIGEVFRLNAAELGISNVNYQVISYQKGGDSYRYGIVPADLGIYTYSPGTLPTDEVTDAQADFRFTAPDAVSSLTLNWSDVIQNISVNAELDWTNPSENFDRVRIEYKLSSETLYQETGEISGTTTAINGLVPGQNYDFRLTSINGFDLPGGVAELTNQTAPGDTVAPGGVGTVNASTKFKTVIANVDFTPATDGDFVLFELISGATVVDTQSANIVQGVTEYGASFTVDTTGQNTYTVRASQFDNSKLQGPTSTSGSVSLTDLVAGDYGSGSIFGSNIGSSTITGSNIASLTIAGSNIANSTITGSKIGSSTITDSNIANATILGSSIGSLTISGNNITNLTITNNKVGDEEFSAPRQARTTGSISVSSGGTTVLTLSSVPKEAFDELLVWGKVERTAGNLFMDLRQSTSILDTSRISADDGTIVCIARYSSGSGSTVSFNLLCRNDTGTVQNRVLTATKLTK